MVVILVVFLAVPAYPVESLKSYCKKIADVGSAMVKTGIIHCPRHLETKLVKKSKRSSQYFHGEGGAFHVKLTAFYLLSNLNVFYSRRFRIEYRLSQNQTAAAVRV
jgi:hypothetical protein